MKVKKTKYGDKPAVRFHCPGCKFSHIVTVDGHKNGVGATWQFNGDVNSPTLLPSLLSTRKWDDTSALTEEDWGPWVPHPTVDGVKSKEPKPEAAHKIVHHKDICHLFVKDGKIQFLGDCTHELKNMTVDMLDMTEEQLKED